MPKNELENELEARVEAFVHDLSDLIRRAALESVNEALGLEGVRRAAPARRRATRGKRAATTTRSRSGGKRVRRSTEDLQQLSDAFLSYVKANPGQRLEEIGVGMRTATKELKRPVQLLVAAKKLRTEGERRGTKYFAGRSAASKTSAKRKTKKRAKRSSKR